MKRKLLLALCAFFIFTIAALAQTKVSGIVYDDANQPLPYVNVYFKGTNEGTITDENGKYYLESQKTYTDLTITFVGFAPKEVHLEKSVNYNMKIILAEANELKEVVLYSGKTSKKNNPAIDILRKIW